jgi:hypothetical protein
LLHLIRAIDVLAVADVADFIGPQQRTVQAMIARHAQRRGAVVIQMPCPSPARAASHCFYFVL